MPPENYPPAEKEARRPGNWIRRMTSPENYPPPSYSRTKGTAEVETAAEAMMGSSGTIFTQFADHGTEGETRLHSSKSQTGPVSLG
ncbi:hypothetical protein CEXT_417131 [Caerostris extrusa]|uniref:Uncharacterized protein n=1 Tax=Caerostris extrusa TaxID=172846 RepID=A0AAV4U372_CAEEX|nr:hypothetical protein CEXT_417131 [Caerostris extrusa]